ncbi:MAG: PD40 domain-containing protein, partial [Planctomycetes bacterium]|nr:PD40 domain-containing protein [Planctomycetota bacterium]
SRGGEPRQLTWYPANGPLPDRWGYDNQVYGWAPDGTAVLFRSLRDAWTTAAGRLYTVAMPAVRRQRGALPVALPMPTAGAGDFSPDGKRLCYSPLFRDFRTWKRYQGGWAQDLFVFDPATGQATNITDHPRTDRDPMWIGEQIWFASDRSGTLNLWSYDLRSRTTNQETTGTTWDVRWPSAGGPGEGRIVYEKGGQLYWFDCVARAEHAITIRVPDEGLLNRQRTIDASGQIESMALSPGGRRALFAAHGDLLTVPREHGDVRNLTRTPGAHDKHARFSPDGGTVAFVSDAGGEEQIWLVDHLGQTAPRQLTSLPGTMLYQPEWSPDGRWVACGDKDGVVRVVAVADGEVTMVADERAGQCRDYCWSPCSGYLAFTLTGTNDLSALMIWSRADGVLHRVSRPLANDTSPAWGPRGERLFFLGLRGFAPRLPGAYEWDFQVDRAMGIYALALRKDLGPWLPPRSDEAVAGDADDRTSAKADAGPVPFDGPITIDFDGLAARVEPIPVEFDNYRGLTANDAGLLFVRRGGSYYGRSPDQPASLQLFARAERKQVTLASDVAGYALSPDGKNVLVRSGGKYHVHEATCKGTEGKPLDLQGLPVDKVPAAEYRQIFAEVWRRYRDFFYVANMHGHDWEALRERYAPLVSWVRHRSDLNYVLGEMIAELNVGHAYIS